MVDVQKRVLNRELGHPARIGDAGFLVPERVDAPELLDQGVGTLDDVRVNLDEMWRLGAMLGGLHGLTAHLLPMIETARGKGETVTVADLGTGGGWLPVYLAEWARRRQARLSSRFP